MFFKVKRAKGSPIKGSNQHTFPSLNICPLAKGGNFKPYGRLHVNLDKSDEFGTFIFRTTGFNRIQTLAARLSYYHAASNGLLSCLPLQLTLRGKSTTQSYRQPVYYVDLTLTDGVDLQSAIHTAREIDLKSKQAGFNQEALDQMARQSYAMRNLRWIQRGDWMWWMNFIKLMRLIVEIILDKRESF